MNFISLFFSEIKSHGVDSNRKEIEMILFELPKIHIRTDFSPNGLLTVNRIGKSEMKTVWHEILYGLNQWFSTLN